MRRHLAAISVSNLWIVGASLCFGESNFLRLAENCFKSLGSVQLEPRHFSLMWGTLGFDDDQRSQAALSRVERFDFLFLLGGEIESCGRHVFHRRSQSCDPELLALITSQSRLLVDPQRGDHLVLELFGNPLKLRVARRNRAVGSGSPPSSTCSAPAPSPASIGLGCPGRLRVVPYFFSNALACAFH